MTWKVQLGTTVVRFDDLSPELFTKVSAKYGMSWLGLYWNPGQNVDACHDLLSRIAEQVGEEPPAYPTTMRAARKMLDSIERMSDDEEDDLPTEWGESGIPLEAGDPTTPGSSGEPAVSVGPPM